MENLNKDSKTKKKSISNKTKKITSKKNAVSNNKKKTTSKKTIISNKIRENKKGIIISIVSIIIIIIYSLTIQFSYSLFNYLQSGKDNNLIAGELYLYTVSGNSIVLNDLFPTDTYDPDNYFEFSVEGKNTDNRDILYEILLEHGQDFNNKIRLDDKFLKFRLTEVVNNQENEIFANKSFDSIENVVIHADSVSKNTTTKIKKIYRLYVYVNGVLIGNTDHCNYTSSEWQKVYSNLNIKVKSNNSMNTYMINYNPNRLSGEYQEVEYIESFGNEYINTNIIPNDNTGIYMKVLNKEINNDTIFIGTSNTSNSSYAIGNKVNNILYGFDQSNQIEDSISENLNIIELNYLNDRKIKLNNSVINSLSTIGTNNNSFTIFALNQNNSIINYSSIKLYELKISVDNTIKYDFIPCYRIEDNVIGLYDIINHKFYESETGALQKGEEKKIKQNVNYDSSVSLLNNLFSNQIDFYEWNTEPDGSGISYKSNQIIKNFANKGEVIDLYAIWSNKLIIDEVKILKTNNSNVVINSSDKLTLNSKIELSNADINNSNVLLSVTLKNNSLYNYSYSGINYVLFDNNDISFDIHGLQKNDVIKSGESITFSINFKYNKEINVNNILNSSLNFVFKNLSGMKLKDLIILNNQNQIEGEDGLYKHNDKYYFSGSKVNNYIWFNCSEGYESGESNCEKWRILSINNDGSINIIKDNVLEKDTIISLEKKTNFWLTNTSQWMTDTKVLAEGRILFDIKGRRPNNQTLLNSYCISTSNGCNAFSMDSKNTGLYKNLKVDLDSLVKKYLDEVYFKYILKDTAKEKIKQYVANIGLIEPSLNIDNILKSESSVTTELTVGLLNLSEYMYANKDNSCWSNFSKCINNSSNNWLTLPDNPYYLINGKIVETDTQADKNAQMWTVQSNGLVSRDANNEYFLRPIVVLKNDVEALGTGIEGDYYIIVS